MHLAPRELDKLLLHQAGFLAQKRLARGLKLNQPESVALNFLAMSTAVTVSSQGFVTRAALSAKVTP